MYCKKCGRELGNDDRFCSSCGTPVTNNREVSKEIDESSQTTKAFTDTGEFVWDVHDFKKSSRRVENVKVDWEKGTVIEIESNDGALKNEPEKDSEAAVFTIDLSHAHESFEQEAETDTDTDKKNTGEVSDAPNEIGTTEEAGKSEKIDNDMAKAGETASADLAGILDIEAEADEEPKQSINEDNANDEANDDADDIPITLEDIQSDIEKDADKVNPNLKRDTARLDKFYTLNKQNEEFQKLLDMEYERIKAGREGSYITPGAVNINEPAKAAIPQAPVQEGDKDSAAAHKGENAEQPVQEEISQEASYEAEPFDPVAHIKKAEEERKAALGLGNLSMMAENYEKQKQNNVYYDDNGEEMRIFDTMELEKDLIESASPAKSKNEIITEISGKIASTKEDIEKTYSSLLDEIFGQIAAAGTAEANDEAKQAQSGEEAHTEHAEAASDSGMTNSMHVTVRFENAAGEKAAQTQEAEQVQGAAAADESPDTVQNSETDAEQMTELDEFLSSEQKQMPFEDNGDTYKKKSPAGKIVLAIVIIVLVAECAVLGIKHLMPESKAAAAINSALDKVAGVFGDDAEDDRDKQQSDDENDGDAQKQDGEKDENIPELPDRSVPESDLSGVIAGLAASSSNIESIVYDASVKYDENHKYNSTLVSSAQPLESNILYEDTNQTAYYVDEEVLKTLIAYNSGWIDYVNNGSNAIFEVLEEGSDAWKNTKAFNTSGISKEFVELNVGEIRTCAQDEYLVWTKEKIKTTKDGKATTDEYSWVYHMKLTAGKLLIVDYYK